MSLEEEIKKLTDLAYQLESTLPAIKYMKEIEEKIFDGELEATDKKDKDQADYDYFQTFPAVKLLTVDENLYFRCMDNLKKVHKKPADSNTDGIESWEFKEDDSNIITTVHRFSVKAPVLRLLQLLLETEKVNQLIEELGTVTTLKEINDFRVIIKTVFKIGMGYADRVTLSYGNTFFNEELKTLLVLTRSLQANELGQVNSEDAKYDKGDCEEVDMKFSYYSIRKLKDGRYEILMGVNSDVKLTGVPDFMANGLIKDISLKLAKVFKKLSDDKKVDKVMDGVYEKKKEMYDVSIKFLEKED